MFVHVLIVGRFGRVIRRFPEKSQKKEVDFSTSIVQKILAVEIFVEFSPKTARGFRKFGKNS